MLAQPAHLISRRLVVEAVARRVPHDLLGIAAEYLTTVPWEVRGLLAGVLIRDRIILEAKRLLVHTDRTVA